MNAYLKDIIDKKRKMIKGKKAFYASLKERFEKNPYSSYGLFKKCIAGKKALHVIAEIKKASPSKGLLREPFDLMQIAQIYARNHVSSISVLTEEQYFLGKPSFVKKVSDNFDIPVLAKDFFLDEGQIYEAMLNGASAILLIVSVLEDAELKEFLTLSRRLDIDCLVEVHTIEELKRALQCGADIIGINNRDLDTFVVDVRTCENIVPHVPSDKVIVAESGIKTYQDVRYLRSLGVDALLIGEAFMTEKDIDQKVKVLMNTQGSET
jgi:indole-3-glycerol phosphate synthase